MAPKFDIYQHVTDQILESLKKGVVPWHNSHDFGLQRNFQSKRPYRGLNQFLLSASEFDCPFWSTGKAVKASGGSVKESEYFSNGGRGTKLVVFWKIIPNKNHDPNSDDPAKKNANIFFLRYYKVWNLEQCEGIEIPNFTPAPDGSDNEPIEICEQIVAEMPMKPEIKKGKKPCYKVAVDTVELPDIKSFPTPEDYYVNAFHELGHSTGHEDRLARDDVMNADWTSYSKEELTAEFTSAFLCGHAGISSEREIDNHADYIAGYMRALGDDKRMLVSAGSKAQRAADFILDVAWDNSSNGDDE